MRMSVWGGENFVTERPVEIEPVSPGVGRIVCPECNGEPQSYQSLFPPELGVTHCINCKGTGFVLVSV